MVSLYHIGFPSIPDAKVAIIPGDPGRVEAIAHRLDNPRFFAQNREYTSWLGELDGKSVLVTSTGIGGASAAIAVEELAQCGVETFLRVGTCGGMAERVRGGDIVVATASIRAEGTTREYLPIEFPAVADIEVTNALIAAAKASGITCHTGVVHSKDSFYGQHSPERMPVGYELQQKWESYIRAGALASEMESAALFAVAQTLGVRAGCVLGVLWNQERRKKGRDDPTGDTELAIDVVIQAARRLI